MDPSFTVALLVLQDDGTERRYVHDAEKASGCFVMVKHGQPALFMCVYKPARTNSLQELRAAHLCNGDFYGIDDNRAMPLKRKWCGAGQAREGR